MLGFRKNEVGMHVFAPKCALLKRKEAFNQSLLLKMSKDCIHCLNLIENDLKCTKGDITLI